MNKDIIEQYLDTFKGSESGYPFGPEALVYKVMGKMFALVSQGEKTPRVTLKCDPTDASMLVSQYESIVPGYYMNKKHWVTISITDEISNELLFGLLKDSYNLVVSKLTKKDKRALEKL